MDGSSAPTESWLGRPCPKCAYVRALSDTNPEWQCPRCHTAYAKWVTRPAAVQGLARHGREMAHEAGADTSLFFLLAANVLTLLVAVYTRMSLTDLMIAYWIQSVMIGVLYVVRILSLERFSTDGVMMSYRQLPETRASKIKVAVIFVAHYGLFSAAHLGLILAFARAGEVRSLLGYVLCGLVDRKSVV